MPAALRSTPSPSCGTFLAIRRIAVVKESQIVRTEGDKPVNKIRAGVLDVAYLDIGPVDGPAAILLHGFPYDAHAYDKVADLLAAAGCRCIVPYLRGYGSTQFLSSNTPRSGEQAALGADLLALLDALSIHDAVLAG